MIRKLFSIGLITLGFGICGGQVEAQVKPFKINGGGVILDDLAAAPGAVARHNSSGQATHLGNHTGLGRVQLRSVDFSTLSGTFRSRRPFRFTAANGDVLAFHYGRPATAAAQFGQVSFMPVEDGLFVAVWVAEFIPVPRLCTGRFTSVIDGNFEMIAVTEPFDLSGGFLPADTNYSWSGEGWIEFEKKNGK